MLFTRSQDLGGRGAGRRIRDGHWLPRLRRLEIIEEHNRDRPDAKIEYASLVGGIQNANKNTQGMLDGYARNNMLQRRRVACLRPFRSRAP